MAYGNGIFVAGGLDASLNCHIESSTDGVEWIVQTPPDAGFSIHAIIYAAGSVNLFIIGGLGTGDAVWTSPDTVTWTPRAGFVNGDIHGMAFDGTTIVAVGTSSGNNPLIQISTNATSWAPVANPFDAGTEILSVTFGGGLFVASGIASGVAATATSSDGTTWTISSPTLPTSVFDCIAYGAGIYVANKLNGPDIVTSPDAAVWTDIVPLPGPPSGTTTAQIADLWFSPTRGYIDLTVEQNRRKFIDASGCVVDLGFAGQTPTGTAPAIFLTVPGNDNPSLFAQNFGSGGSFAATGPIFATLTRPCCGVTSLPAVPPSEPEVRLSVSDDGGRTWSLLQKPRSMGKIGQYLKRLRWLKMGQFRQRIIKLEVTDPVRRNFIGFYEDISEGLE